MFIQPYLTLNQQKIDKELRDKLREMRAQGETEAKIKNGKIVKKTRETVRLLFCTNQW